MTGKSVLLSVGVLFVAVAIGIPAVTAAPADGEVHDWDWPWEDDDDWFGGDVDLSEVSVSSTTAFETVGAETEQKPVELELGTNDGTPVWEILTAGSDGMTRFVIDATNGTLLETSTLNIEEPEALAGFNLSALRPATEAVQIAQNETNGTVTDVELQADDGLVFYEVDSETEDGTETTVYVAPTENPVLGVQSEDD